jgi:hypothetical protein
MRYSGDASENPAHATILSLRGGPAAACIFAVRDLLGHEKKTMMCSFYSGGASMKVEPEAVEKPVHSGTAR